jgi:hypothetical protein
MPEDGGLITAEGEFESVDAFAEMVWVGSGLGESTAGEADVSTTPAAAVLLSEATGLAPSLTGDTRAAGLPGVEFDSCAMEIAGALASDPGFNRLAADAGVGADDDSKRGALEFVGVATAGALVVKDAGEFELAAGWDFLPYR